MRGLEGALEVYKDVQNGAFASEALRKIYNEISPNDRKLTATLVYCTLRRQSLWKTVLQKYCRRNFRELSKVTQNALMIGAAGITELKNFALPVLVNGLVQAVKKDGPASEVAVVNAVLHSVAEKSGAFLEELKSSSALRDIALYYGVPGWAAAQWAKDSSIAEAKRLVRACGMRTYLSLRLSRGVKRDEYMEEYNASGRKCWTSPFLDFSVRTASNPYPIELPGFDEGKIMPQSESSMFAAHVFASRVKGMKILDMCCGRGVKTGQIADSLPDARIEAWDVSGGKIASAKSEAARIGASARVSFKRGDALSLTPDETPDAVLLDAPCSGSGTWGRKPESKWRASPEMLKQNFALQRRLLERAASLASPGGIIAYCTCSVFRDENEKVVADVMAECPELIELPIDKRADFMAKGRPYGMNILPALPWVDGFYMALLAKRK